MIRIPAAVVHPEAGHHLPVAAVDSPAVDQVVAAAAAGKNMHSKKCSVSMNTFFEQKYCI